SIAFWYTSSRSLLCQATLPSMTSSDSLVTGSTTRTRSDGNFASISSMDSVSSTCFPLPVLTEDIQHHFTTGFGVFRLIPKPWASAWGDVLRGMRIAPVLGRHALARLDRLQLVGQPAPLFLEIVHRLQVQPKLCLGPKDPLQP